MEVVRTTTERAVAVLQNASYQEKVPRQEHVGRLREMILPQVDPRRRPDLHETMTE